MQDNQYILVTVSGQDSPGITARLMKILTKHQCQIKDMGQSVTHGLLSLSFLFDGEHSDTVVKDLLFEAKKMHLTLDFQVVENGFSEQTEPLQKFILSCVAVETIGPEFLANISAMLAHNNINILRIDNNTCDSLLKAVEITTTSPKDVNWQTLKRDLLQISEEHRVDMAFLKDNVYRRNKRLIVFDMDSTIIQTEVIDEMAKLKGVGDQVQKITSLAMNGEIDFNQSLIERVQTLKGLKEHQLQDILQQLPFNPGVEDFVRTVKSLGYKVAIISGGFTYFANALKDKLGIDYAFANELEVKNGELTGKVKGTIINAEQKALLVDLLAQQEQISLEQVVAIGDGANDLPMLSKAGLGIAYHAKDIVKRKASQNMSHGPMTSILYFLGISETDAVQLN